jgi:hypothetical protein
MPCGDCERKWGGATPSEMTREAIDGYAEGYQRSGRWEVLRPAREI